MNTEKSNPHQAEIARLRQVFEHINYAIAIYEAVDHGNDFIVKEFNQYAESIDQIEKEKVAGRSVLEVFSGIKIWGLFEVFQRVWKTGKAEYFSGYYQDALTAGWRKNYIYKLNSGEIVSVYCDNTKNKQEEESMRISEKKFREIFSQSPIGIAVYNAQFDLVDANEAFLTLFGLAGIKNAKELDLFKNLSSSKLVKRSLIDGETVRYEGEVNFDQIREQDHLATIKSGRSYFDYLVAPLKTERDSCYGFIMHVQDITARKIDEKELTYLCFHDSLTGCFNRAYFDQEMKRIQSSRLASVGIIIFDVDGLKLLNDTLGHAAGDALLVAGADVIKRCFRSGDMVARIGGDEFIVLLPNSDMASIETGCERVQKEIELYNEMSGKLPLSISIGYAVGYDVKETANLLKEADHHLYREKLYRKGNFHNHIIKTLVGTLKVKDFFSQGHAQRLTFWAEEFSFKRKLDASIRKNLRLLAQYHDIGKVGVSDGPLFKDGVLTHDEEKEVERHCEIGHRIALSAPGLVPVADMILKHHEWWNGEGYPLGLQGEAIPFECRVFSIIDAFEAMTSDRPYRRAMSITRSVQELKRYSGLQFDPGLVNEFVHFMNR